MAWVCSKCGSRWHFPVQECVRCRVPVRERSSDRYVVRGTTEVAAGTNEHLDVPYYVLLLEDPDGRFLVRKSLAQRQIGEEIIESPEEVRLPKIGVVGTGVTGAGIAEVALLSGCDVVLRGRSEESLQRAVGKVQKGVAKRAIDEEALRAKMDSLVRTTEMSALADVDIAIEAVVEDIDVKREVFEEIDAVCGERVVLATNTSSLSVSEVAKATKNPERVVGMHFFNPVTRMRLVEVVRGEETAEWAVEATRRAAVALGKTPVVVKDSPGFIVNRLLMTFLEEAVRLVEDDVAERDDIDAAVELGLNHPMGPLKLLDLIGIDIFCDIMSSLHEHIPDRFHVPESARRMNEDNTLGRKTGKGFYEY